MARNDEGHEWKRLERLRDAKVGGIIRKKILRVRDYEEDYRKKERVAAQE
jgi:hypothetical protein